MTGSASNPQDSGSLQMGLDVGPRHSVGGYFSETLNCFTFAGDLSGDTVQKTDN